MPDTDLIDMVYTRLKKDVDTVRRRQKQTAQKSEGALFTDGLVAFAYADLPTDGLGDNVSYITIVFVSDGRKSGEGAGAGTGVVAYYDVASGNWLNIADYSQVLV